jgi:hypothetical protein
MIRNAQFIKRKLGDQYVIVAVGEASKRFHGMISVNGSGSLLWDCLEKECEINDLVLAMTDTYEIDADTARADVLEFLTNLKEVGAVEGE